MVIDTVKNPLAITAIIYVVLLVVIFLSNISNQFAREKQMLFYYIISIILPILIYVFVLVVFF